MSGEGYGSWAEMIIADANLGGQGSNNYHVAFQKAVVDGDASCLETLASTSEQISGIVHSKTRNFAFKMMNFALKTRNFAGGADAATVLCYLNPA